MEVGESVCVCVAVKVGESVGVGVLVGVIVLVAVGASLTSILLLVPETDAAPDCITDTFQNPFVFMVTLNECTPLSEAI